MPTTLTSFQTYDIRFPTSRTLAGSDAIHPDPDYSGAYIILHTDSPYGLEGHGLTFTIGRGNGNLCGGHQRTCSPHHRANARIFDNTYGTILALAYGGKPVALAGTEKGVIHLATAAIVNAVWDLYAKIEQKPLWKLLTDMSPEQLVSCIDFRYISDALTTEEALTILHQRASTKAQREAEMRETGFPAYTTSAGWLGYNDEKCAISVAKLSR